MFPFYRIYNINFFINDWIKCELNEIQLDFYSIIFSWLLVGVCLGFVLIIKTYAPVFVRRLVGWKFLDVTGLMYIGDGLVMIEGDGC